MADVIYKKGQSSNLNNVQIKEGQILVTEDTGEMYIDVTDKDRKKINGLSNSKLGSAILIDDISPVTHEMSVKISSDTVTDLTAVKVTRQGKNLFGLSKYSISTDYLGATSNTTQRTFEENKVYLNLSRNNYYVPDHEYECEIVNDTSLRLICKGTRSGFEAYGAAVIFKVVPGQKYTVSANYDESTNSLTGMGFFSADGFRISDSSGDYANVTVPANAYWMVVVFSCLIKNEYTLITDIQLELNTTATDYEPYVEPTEYIPNADGTVNGVTSLYPNTTLMTDTEGVLIDCEYLTNNYKPVLDNRVPKQTQSDWQQNDETANDYVKNRPGGYIDNDTIVKIPEKYLDIKNTNIVNGSAEGSIRSINSKAEDDTYTIGTNAFAEGYATEASGNHSHAEGYYTKASGDYSHAEGYYATASIYGSHAEGNNTTASGVFSHAEGYSTTASGDESHTEGYGTTASAYGSHAEGYHTKASGTGSHAEGYYTIASGERSHAEGYDTIASGNDSHAQGKYNISNTTYADVIGNGSSDTERSNAYTMDWSGNAWFAGDVYIRSTSGKNKDEGSKKLATEEYIDKKIEVSDTAPNEEENKIWLKPITEGPAGSDATVTDASIKTALGYTPAKQDDVSKLSEEIVDKVGQTDLETEVENQLDGAKADIVTELLAQIGGMPVFGTVDDNNTITITTMLPGGEYSLMYENEDGTLTEIGTIIVEGETLSYTNLVPTSIDTDGSIYNDVGYMNNMYISSSTGLPSSHAGIVTTGYMELPLTFYVKGVSWNISSSMDRIFFYDSNFNKLDYRLAKEWGIAGIITEDVGNGFTKFTIPQPNDSDWPQILGYKYIRMCLTGSGDNFIVTTDNVEQRGAI